jgi:hypothetical protein
MIERHCYKEESTSVLMNIRNRYTSNAMILPFDNEFKNHFYNIILINQYYWFYFYFYFIKLSNYVPFLILFENISNTIIIKKVFLLFIYLFFFIIIKKIKL